MASKPSQRKMKDKKTCMVQTTVELYGSKMVGNFSEFEKTGNVPLIFQIFQKLGVPPKFLKLKKKKMGLDP